MHKHVNPVLLALVIGYSGTPPAKREEVTGYKKRVKLSVQTADSNPAGSPGTFTLTVFTLCPITRASNTGLTCLCM